VSSVVHWRVLESFLCDDATITGYSDCAIAGAYEEGWSCSSVVGILSAVVKSDQEVGRRIKDVLSW